MIIIILLYVVFLLVYLPFNFYMVYRLYELRIHRETPTALLFLILGVGLIVLISFIAIAAYPWPTTLDIFKEPL